MSTPVTQNTPWTTQEAYEHICARLAEQGERSLAAPNDDDGGEPDCLFVGHGGCRCAVAWLVPDSELLVEFDTKALSADEVKARVPIMCDLSSEFLTKVQIAHDVAKCPEHVQRNLQRVARDCGLKPGAELAITKWS